jgi:hypothetical protein
MNNVTVQGLLMDKLYQEANEIGIEFGEFFDRPYNILSGLKYACVHGFNHIEKEIPGFGDNSFEGKPVAIMSASTGMLGGAKAQYHLRQMFVFLDMYPVNRPEVMVPFAAERIDKNGIVTDEKTREKIKELLESLVSWTRRVKKE